MSSLFFVLRSFDWDGETAFSGEVGVWTGAPLLPKNECQKNPDFQTNTWVEHWI